MVSGTGSLVVEVNGRESEFEPVNVSDTTRLILGGFLQV